MQIELKPETAIAIAHATAHRRTPVVMTPGNEATAKLFLSIKVGAVVLNIKGDGTWTANTQVEPSALEP